MVAVHGGAPDDPIATMQNIKRRTTVFMVAPACRPAALCGILGLVKRSGASFPRALSKCATICRSSAAQRASAVAKLQRSREPFVGCASCGQPGESPVEHRWTARKRPSNRLFLLSFFEADPVHEKALAKRRGPYYAWCSSGTSTQDVVDFDLQALSG